MSAQPAHEVDISCLGEGGVRVHADPKEGVQGGRGADHGDVSEPQFVLTPARQ